MQVVLHKKCGYCKPCSMQWKDVNCILVQLYEMGSAFRLSKEDDSTYCLICQESIKTDFLHDHIQMHSGVNPAACKNCLKEFDSPEILRKHYLDCKFRKKGEYKCLFCSNIENCADDLMYHFNNLHSSRLNWSLKPMIDAIFLNGDSEQEIDQPAVDKPFDFSTYDVRSNIRLFVKSGEEKKKRA